MVRHDPANERGPAPPNGRQQMPPSRRVAETLFQLRPVEEYEYLWQVAVTGAHTSLDTLAGYTRISLPVDSLPDLYELRGRLDNIIQQAEARNEL